MEKKQKEMLSEQNKIYNMDFLDGIDMLIEKGIQIDAIITDPPYNISKDNNFKTMGRAGIDFGEWDKGFDQLEWIKKSYPLLKKGGSLFVFNSWRNLGDIAAFAESVGYEVKDVVRWVKNNPMPRNRDRRYIVDFEFAMWLVKPGDRWTFNRLSDKYDRPEYKYPITPKGEKIDKGHPTQKPIALMEEIILRHTNENDLILDGFIGSGTTCLASIKTGRNYIGFDKDETSYKMTKQRLMEVTHNADPK